LFYLLGEYYYLFYLGYSSFSLLLLKRTLTLWLLLLGVFFSLREFISMWNARIVGGISSVSSPINLYLDSRIYNIPYKIRDRCIRRKNKGKNGIL